MPVSKVTAAPASNGIDTKDRAADSIRAALFGGRPGLQADGIVADGIVGTPVDHGFPVRSGET